MGSRTVYTSTISVPVYASWKCEECGEINLATGVIVCKREESSSSWSSTKQQQAEETASKKARTEWVEEAYKIITDPNHSGSLMYNNLHLQNTNCTKCNKKPRWNKNVKFLPIFGLVFMTAIISGIAAFAILTSVLAWLIFISSVGFIVWGIAREEVYKKMMVKLPKGCTPIIGSLNAELIEYANQRGKKIPNPDECIEIVKGFANISSAEKPSESCVFCRKCGAKLASDSTFCHKCGTEIKKCE